VAAREIMNLPEVMAVPARAAVPVKIIIMVPVEAQETKILKENRNIAEVQVTAKIEENSEGVLVP
jgi:hypothetical protein